MTVKKIFICLISDDFLLINIYFFVLLLLECQFILLNTKLTFHFVSETKEMTKHIHFLNIKLCDK